MEENHDMAFEMPLVFLCGGCCAFLLGVVQLYRTRHILKTGTLVDAKVLISTKRDFVVQYVTGAGEMMVRTTPNRFKKRVYRRGDGILLRYAVERPKTYRIVNIADNRATGDYVLVAIGSMFFVVGLYLVLFPT